MEASQFTQGEELAATDPFGENGMGDFEQGEDPFQEGATAEPVPGLPVVDAEGQEVTNEETQAAPEPVADEPVAAEPEPVADAAEPDPTPVAQPSPGGSEPSDEQEERKAQSEALPRAEVGSDGQKVAKKAEAKEKPHGTVRGYYLLVPEGDGKFVQLEWYEDKDGNVTSKEKGKKTRVAKVAGKREALATAFAALGEPNAGAKVVAAPVSYFGIKTVKGKDDPPPRRRPVVVS